MLISISRSHLTFSKIYWIIAVSGRQIALLTVVIVKSMSQRQYPLKILGTWKGIDRLNLRNIVIGA
jgi:hypothetical protein